MAISTKRAEWREFSQTDWRNQATAVDGFCRRAMGLPTEPRHDAAMDEDRQAIKVRLRSARQLREARVQQSGPGHDTEGGFAAPGDEFASSYELALDSVSSLRKHATVIRTVSGRDFRWVEIDDTNTEAEIITETTPAGEDDVEFGVRIFRHFLLSSRPVRASSSLIEDGGTLFTGELGRLLGRRIGRKQNRLFSVGNGSNEPHGLMTAAPVGVTAALADSVTADELLGLMFSVDSSYRESPNCAWFLHSDSMQAILGLKDNDGRPVYDRTARQLLGFPIAFSKHCPTMASGARSIAFGDLSRYVIVEAGEMRLAANNERFAEVDQSLFLALQRCGGGLLNASYGPVKVLVHP